MRPYQCMGPGEKCQSFQCKGGGRPQAKTEDMTVPEQLLAAQQAYAAFLAASRARARLLALRAPAASPAGSPLESEVPLQVQVRCNAEKFERMKIERSIEGKRLRHVECA